MGGGREPGRGYRRCRAFERDREVQQEYLALAERVGNPWAMAAACFTLGSHPDLERSLQIAQEHGLTDWQARAQVRLADLCKGQEPLRAEALLRQALQAPEWQAPEYLPNYTVQTAYDLLMRVYVLPGKWDELAATLRQSISSGGTGPLGGGYYLSTMEEALDEAGKRAEFLAFCEEAKALYAHAGLPLSLNQWYLEPAIPSTEFRRLQFQDEFEAPELRPEWQWHDPAHVSSYSLSERPGHLTLRPGERVSLYPGLNLNAPRMLLPVCGDFALETKLEVDERVGTSSGLLVWKDVLNYVRFDKQGTGQHARSIRLQGRIRGEFWIWGQGLLRGDTFHLRLERTGDRFAALCSTDGEDWLTCGHVDLPVGDPLRVGVWAAGGMGVHFDYVQVLGRG